MCAPVWWVAGWRTRVLTMLHPARQRLGKCMYVHTSYYVVSDGVPLRIASLSRRRSSILGLSLNVTSVHPNPTPPPPRAITSSLQLIAGRTTNQKNVCRGNREQGGDGGMLSWRSSVGCTILQARNPSWTRDVDIDDTTNAVRVQRRSTCIRRWVLSLLRTRRMRNTTGTLCCRALWRL